MKDEGDGVWGGQGHEEGDVRDATRGCAIMLFWLFLAGLGVAAAIAVRAVVAR